LSYVLLIVLLAQFAIGVFLYIDARRAAKRAILDFIRRANHLDERFKTLGLAVDQTRKQGESRLEVLGTAVDQIRKQGESRLEVLGTAVGHLCNRVEVLFDHLAGLEWKSDQLQQQMIATKFALTKKSSPDEIVLGSLDEVLSEGFKDTAHKQSMPVSGPNQRERTAVIIVLGQSNAANHGEGHYVSTESVANFNVYDGHCYHAADPLLGASGLGGNFATRFGDIVIRRGLFDRLIIAPIAMAGSTVEQWADEGHYNRLIMALIRRLYNTSLTPDFIFWQQGVGNVGAGDIAGRIYRKNILEVVRTFRSFSIDAPFFIALESGKAVNDPDALNIRSGQRGAVSAGIGTFLGPDIDLIEQDHRRDGCHFKESGLQIVATMWADVLREFLINFDWTAAITAHMPNRPVAVNAEKFLRRRQTGSQPIDLQCADGHTYVVKGLRNDDPKQGRMLFNDHVVAHLGGLIGAPVLPVRLVSISKGLIDRHQNPNNGMDHIRPGIAHGSYLQLGLGDRVNSIEYAEYNRTRFASLAILYAWAEANDQHFLYDSEHRVYSVDHGNFFPGGPHWTERELESVEPRNAPRDIIKACCLSRKDLAAACAPLQTVDEEQIARILATAPDEWGVNIPERVALAKLLRRRQLQLLAVYLPEYYEQYLDESFGFEKRLRRI
jgi:hypothetical protein